MSDAIHMCCVFLPFGSPSSFLKSQFFTVAKSKSEKLISRPFIGQTFCKRIFPFNHNEPKSVCLSPHFWHRLAVAPLLFASKVKAKSRGQLLPKKVVIEKVKSWRRYGGSTYAHHRHIHQRTNNNMCLFISNCSIQSKEGVSFQNSFFLLRSTWDAAGLVYEMLLLPLACSAGGL